MDRLLSDLVQITNHSQGAAWIKTQLALATVRTFNASSAPDGFAAADLAQLFDQFLPRFRSDGADWDVKDNADPNGVLNRTGFIGGPIR